MASVLDKTFTLRQVRNWLLVALVFGAVWYAYQFFSLAQWDHGGGVPAVSSPYYSEIPENCRNFSDRRGWYGGVFPDGLLLRPRPIRLGPEYLSTEYGRFRCLGYVVLTGLHAQDPRGANFVDTYVDERGDPIVRINVEYFQTYNYNPSKPTPANSENTK